MDGTKIYNDDDDSAARILGLLHSKTVFLHVLVFYHPTKEKDRGAGYGSVL